MNESNITDNDESGRNSDSKVQREIEKIVMPAVANILQMELISGFFELQDVKFQIDFYNKENSVFGEIYSGVESLKPGQTRKIAMDVLKLLTIEKLLKKPVDKYLVFIDEEIKRKFSASSSWYSRSIKEFEIKILYIPLTESTRQIIIEAKKRQYR